MTRRTRQSQRQIDVQNPVRRSFAVLSYQTEGSSALKPEIYERRYPQPKRRLRQAPAPKRQIEWDKFALAGMILVLLLGCAFLLVQRSALVKYQRDIDTGNRTLQETVTAQNTLHLNAQLSMNLEEIKAKAAEMGLSYPSMEQTQVMAVGSPPQPREDVFVDEDTYNIDMWSIFRQLLD